MKRVEESLTCVVAVPAGCLLKGGGRRAWHLLTRPAAMLDIQEESADQRDGERRAASNRHERRC